MASKFIEVITQNVQQKLTGIITAQTSGEMRWQLYFYQGRLVWATETYHAARRLKRHLNQHFPKIDYQSLAIGNNEAWDYHPFLILVKNQLLTKEQLGGFMQDIISEVLFDLNFQDVKTPLVYNVEPNQTAEPIKYPLALLNPVVLIKEVLAKWGEWEKMGLKQISPNSAPIIKQPEQLQQQTSATTFKNLTAIANGKRTLREMAIFMKQDLIKVIPALIPHFKTGYIALVAVPDIARPNSATRVTQLKSSGVAKLIACVDDSPIICQMMKDIIEKAGYRFISIEQASQALPLLLKSKPDLVFLDLMMPVTNGHELCIQLRRMSAFKETPLIILTGTDTMGDRVRSKVVGASDYVTKPIETEKVLGVIKKHLSVRTPPS